MQAIPVLYLQKSYIAAHTRKAKDGSVVQVAAYYDKRQKKGAEHAPAHDHPVKHLSGEAQARFDAMHREQHLLHHYQGHALRKRIAEHEGKVKVLQERADAFEKQGAKKSATAMRNKILRHESDLIRHRRALEKVDKHVKALGGMKESLVSGSGKVEPSTDESHQKYVDKLGSPWKPMKTPVGAEPLGDSKPSQGVPKPELGNERKKAKLEDTGPQEGERNAEGLVFRNGRWHREEDKTPTQDHPQAATPPGGAKDKAVQDSGVPVPAKADVEIPERTAKDDAEDMEGYIYQAADSIGKLRGMDVYRVLSEAPRGKQQALAKYIKTNRADLSNYVDDAADDLDIGIEKAAPVSGMRGEVDIAGQEVPHTWKLVEASELEATRGKADNQFRDRDRAASDEQVQAMAGNLKFKQLAESPIMDYGAPTLAKDGKTVIGGNGRVLAIGKAYSQGKAGNYKAELADNAAKFGFDKADVEGMSQPVLIRVLSKDVDIKQAAIASNEGGGARMSALEQAKVDGERMGDLTDFRPDDSGNLNNAANRDFVRRFMASVPVAQRPAFQSKDGLLSQEGMTRLRNAVLYRAYGDSDVLSRMAEDTDAGQKNLLTALTRMAPVVAQAKADAMVGNLYDLDISADIVAAAHTLAQIKAEGTFSGAEDYFRQQNLFGDTLNDESKQLLIYFDHNLRSAKSLQQFLGDYYQAVQTLGSPRQAGMFGNATPTKQQLLRNASEKRKQTGEEGDLFGKSHSGPGGEGGRQPADAGRAEGRDGKGRGEAQGNALGPRVLFFTRPARTAA